MDLKKRIAIFVAITGVAFAALLYASPYIALRSIGKAIDRRDAEAVSEYVDFPALRENVKGQLLVKMQAEMNTPAMAGNPFAAVGQMLAAGFINQFTETMISPAGVMLMLENGKASKPTDIAAAGARIDTKPTRQRVDLVVDYQGWSKVFVHPKNEPGGFIFRRDGLIGWKLTGIRMD